MKLEEISRHFEQKKGSHTFDSHEIFTYLSHFWKIQATINDVSKIMQKIG